MKFRNIMKTQDFLIQNNTRVENLAKKIQQDIQDQNTYFFHYSHHVEMLNSKISVLESALNSLHLTINNVSFFVTGASNAVKLLWVPGDTHLRVTVMAIPNDQTFHFITHKGYTERGNGRNERQLRDKAIKMKEKIYHLIDLQVEINPFSLEERPEYKMPRVLIEFNIQRNE